MNLPDDIWGYIFNTLPAAASSGQKQAETGVGRTLEHDALWAKTQNNQFLRHSGM